jgi:ribosomal protein L39E
MRRCRGRTRAPADEGFRTSRRAESSPERRLWR